MPASCYVNITSDGGVNTYDVHGVKINDLSGDLKMLHHILAINKMSGKEKAKLPVNTRLRNTSFFFMREDIQEVIPIPIQHITKFVESVEKGSTEQFIIDLQLNALNNGKS